MQINSIKVGWTPIRAKFRARRTIGITEKKSREESNGSKEKNRQWSSDPSNLSNAPCQRQHSWTNHTCHYVRHRSPYRPCHKNSFLKCQISIHHIESLYSVFDEENEKLKMIDWLIDWWGKQDEPVLLTSPESAFCKNGALSPASLMAASFWSNANTGFSCWFPWLFFSLSFNSVRWIEFFNRDQNLRFLWFLFVWVGSMEKEIQKDVESSNWLTSYTGRTREVP